MTQKRQGMAHEVLKNITLGDSVPLCTSELNIRVFVHSVCIKLLLLNIDTGRIL